MAVCDAGWEGGGKRRRAASHGVLGNLDVPSTGKSSNSSSSSSAPPVLLFCACSALASAGAAVSVGLGVLEEAMTGCGDRVWGLGGFLDKDGQKSRGGRRNSSVLATGLTDGVFCVKAAGVGRAGIRYRWNWGDRVGDAMDG